MLFAADIGNSTIRVGVMGAQGWVAVRKLHTEAQKTSDEAQIEMEVLLDWLRLDRSAIDQAVVSSVVPSLTMVYGKVCYNLFGFAPVIVDHRTEAGLVAETVPEELGSDLLCDLAAAHEAFPGEPATVLDFGTALTVSTVSGRGEVLGVAIAPGLVTSVNALSGSAAQLPAIQLKLPDSVLGRTTIQSIRAGILYGCAGLVERLLAETQKEIGSEVKVVATGGLCNTIAPLIKRIDLLDRNHTLNGLALIGRLNPRG